MTGKLVVNCDSLYDCPYRKRTYGRISKCSFSKCNEDCSFIRKSKCNYVITLKDALNDLGIKTK